MPTTSIDIWKNRLLDLSRRNRLLHLRAGASGVIALTNPPAAELFGLLTRKRKLEFADALTPEQRLDALGWDAPATGTTTRLDRITPPKPKVDQLATDRPPADQERALYTMRLRARTVLGEQGINVLYVAVGFLEWLTPGAGETFWRSPLLLVPVELTRSMPGGRYSLRMTDDEIALNPTLVYKLRKEFGLALPELPDDDDFALEPFFAQIEALIAGNDGWQVARECALGLFSFLKLLMYNDLEHAAAKAEQHPLLGLLAGTSSAAGLATPPDPLEEQLAPPDAQYALDARPPEYCYQVLDADSSQASAVAAARTGGSFVLQGPPGTGKSQTITNIIAELLADGKRVLFVSEKMAALQVVYERLAQSGLGDFCLELHSHKASKRAVLQTLDTALSAAPPPSDPAFPYAELGQARDQLNMYAQALHSPDPALGWTPFSVHGRLAVLADAPDTSAPIGELESYTHERLGAADALLTRLDAQATLLQAMPENIWRGCAITNSSFEQRGRVRARLRALLAALGELEREAGAFAALLGAPQPQSLANMRALLAVATLLRESQSAPPEWLDSAAEAVRRRALIAEAAPRYTALADAEARLFQRYIEGVLDLELDGLHERFATQYTDWSRALRPQFHRDIGALRAQARPGAEVSPDSAATDLQLAIAVRDARQWANANAPELNAQLAPLFADTSTNWAQLAASADWAARLLALDLPQPLPAPIIQAATQAPAARAALLAAAERLARALAPADAELQFVRELQLERAEWQPDALERASYALLHTQLAQLLERMGELDQWWEYCELQAAAESIGMGAFVDAISRDAQAAAQPRHAFYKRLCQRWLDRAYDQMPVLRRFTRSGHEALIERFRRLDREQMPATQARLRRLLAGRRPDLSSVAMPGSELATLRRELQKQRRHKPIRQLFREIPQLLGQLKPCMLMSPLSISQFLDPALPPFDLVIFDEASQIRTEDAIGAIMRGQSLIVVGDNRQLPPTSFFATDDEPDEDDDAAGEIFESILDAAGAAGLPTRLLRWHYRSRDETLITFSNQQFYNARLATFPNAHAAPNRGVRLEHVPDGVYDRQGSRTNANEARRVADLVIAHWRTNPAQSLGVVTFSQPQQLAVLHALERSRADDESLAPLFDENRPEAFFVKNLENVQGDERDAMIISVGYGRDSGGRLLMNFGPLNQAGGERRLNVAITRARDRVTLVSSLLPEDIDLKRVQNPGPRLLREYLDYARHGGPANPLESSNGARPAAPPRPLSQSLDPRFEDRLAVALAKRGLQLARQIGHSDFRIDIAVRDPHNPQQFRLGIECDGEDFRTAPSARDRERLREQVLSTLGWRIHRAWSAEWAHDPEAEVDRVLAALEEATGAAQTL